MKVLKSLLSTCLLTSSLLFAEEYLIDTNGVTIWCETFGKKDDTPLLLIMGAGGQGIMWPSELCERLVEEGFYVIRYDHRDTGYSTCVDFEKDPYNLLDLTQDALSLLDALEIKKVHLCGLSMGGPIAEWMAIQDPTRVLSITLIATSCDFRPLNRAFANLPAEEGALSRPKESYLSWMKKFLAKPAKNQEEALEQRMACWRLLNGDVVPFEEERYLELHKLFLARQKSSESIKNHVLVCVNSEDMIKAAPQQVKVPSLIIHGTEDPLLPLDHAAALESAISGSKCLLVEGMGHLPNRHFYELMIKEMKEFHNACQSK